MKTPHEVWGLVEALEGEVFTTITGKQFTYEVEGSAIWIKRDRRVNQRIGKSNFAVAMGYGPLSGPGGLHSKTRGPSYIWAILHDPRLAVWDLGGKFAWGADDNVEVTPPKEEV